MTRLGRQQLKLLMVLGSPSMALVVPDRLSLSLVKRGMLTPRRPEKSDGFLTITPAGLRRLAEALEGGELAQFLASEQP